MTKDFDYAKISCQKWNDIFSNDIKNKNLNSHYIFSCGGLKLPFRSYSHFESIDVQIYITTPNFSTKDGLKWNIGNMENMTSKDIKFANNQI
jgi:5-formaminoimidazole-4-carboxamide-1-beta-D-ribofuranosyl 5'-monophosphate synthetase